MTEAIIAKRVPVTVMREIMVIIAGKVKILNKVVNTPEQFPLVNITDRTYVKANDKRPTTATSFGLNEP